MSESSGPRVACAGDNCVDRYLGDRPVDLVGGNALNVAVRLSLAGMPSSFLGRLGRDPEGHAILSALRDTGVDTLRLEIADGPSGLTTVHVGDGERTFVSEDYGVAAAYCLDADVVLEIPGIVWLHGSRLADTPTREGVRPWPLDRHRSAATMRAFARLKRVAVKLSYDFTDAWQPGLLEALCRHLEVAFFSGAALDEGAARDVAKGAVARGALTAVVTRGAGGAIALTGRQEHRRDAEPVDVVDTLGAGDALIAGFVAARLRGASVEDALDCGVREAADACTYRGAWTLEKGLEAADA